MLDIKTKLFTTFYLQIDFKWLVITKFNNIYTVTKASSFVVNYG